MKYMYETIADILRLSEEMNISFAEVVIQSEMENYEISRAEVLEKAQIRLDIFSQSVRDGLDDVSKTGSRMSGGEARQLIDQKPLLLGELAYKAMTYALAVNEANAKMFRIVACPTAGSCGVMPGCMEAVKEVLNLSDEKVLEGFFVGAGIGKVITERACVAGAVGGCQAEVGTATAMAAGAVVAMLGGSAKKSVEAMTLALKNVLGLVCDPVAGLVEVPCVKRNGVYAVHALTAAEMAMAGIESQIPADEVIAAMNAIGHMIPSCLRETSEGGLAKTPTGVAIAERVKNL